MSFQNLGADARIALRRILREPALMAFLALSLGIGVGLNSVVFSIINTVLLNPFPFPAPEQLSILWSSKDFDRRTPLTTQAFELLKDSHCCNRIARFQLNWSSVTINNLDMSFDAVLLGTNGFDVLGRAPHIGRVFHEAEAKAETPVESTVVLSYGLWQKAFAGREVIGEELLIDDRRFTVLGVMPSDFFFPDRNVDLWLPLTEDSGLWSSSHALVRLGRGTSHQSAQAELDHLAQLLEASASRQELALHSLRRLVLGDAERTAWTVQGIVALLLVLTCVNTVVLMLARAVKRTGKTATQLALGASPSRILQQFLTESFLLSMLAGLVAMGLTVVVIQQLPQLSLPELNSLNPPTVNTPLVGLIFLAVIAAGLLIGTVPGLGSLRGPHILSLQQSPLAGMTPRHSRLLGLLVAGEIGMATVLLIAVCLLLTSFLNITRVNWGFDPSSVAVARIELPREWWKDATRRNELSDLLQERLQALPAVSTATIGPGIPFRYYYANRRLTVDGRIISRDWVAKIWEVDPEYFAALGLTFLEGRPFTARDRQSGVGSVVVSRTLAERISPGKSPIGIRFGILEQDFSKIDDDKLIARPRSKDPEVVLNPEYYEAVGKGYEIVGVVDDVRTFGLDFDPGPQIYVDNRTWLNDYYIRHLHVAARVSRGEAADVLPALRNQIQGAKPVVRVAGLTTLDQLVRNSVGALASTKPLLMISMIFAGLTALLAIVGIVGIQIHHLTHSLYGLAIRSAVGGSPINVMKTAIQQNARWLTLGLLGGLLAAIKTGRLLETMLFGVSPQDPGTLIWVTLGFAIVSFAGLALPAFRAVRVQPADTLRRH